MSPRARRLLTASVIVAAFLVLGRALTQFLADRWWAASVSPSAVLVITRRALLGLGLDIAGVTLATLWFATHAGLCLRVLSQIPEREPGGNTALRAFIARPGARAESMTNYLERLGRLERLAMTMPGVQQAFAIQAGREVRVVVQPNVVTDDQAHALAKTLKLKIEQELDYPSTIKVTVIREQRYTETAT